MTHLDLADPGSGTASCAACGAAGAGRSATRGDSATPVCRKCGRSRRAASPARHVKSQRSLPRGEPEILEAARRPLVTYSDRGQTAWAARIESDTLYEPRPRSRVPLTAAGVVALLFIAAFFAGRHAAVAAVPDLAGLYAAIGLPVNLKGLAVEDVAVTRSPAGSTARLSLQGAIRNVSDVEQAVPALTASLRDSADRQIALRGFAAPVQRLAPGATSPFAVAIEEGPRQASQVVVRFRRAADDVTSEEAGPASQ